MASVKLTKTVIEAIKPESEAVIRYDSEIPGLHVKVYPSGRITFAIWYRTKAGRPATYTIGQFGPVTLVQARSIAAQVILEVKKGGDPAKDLSLRKAALTVAELCDKYLAEHVALRNKASTARDACRIVETRIRPALGGIKVADVKRADVIKWHNSMKAIPAEANRCLAYLSKMMTLASRDWNLRLDNPVSGVSRYPEVRRARFLSDEEFNRLGATLDQAEKYGAESLAVVAAIRLLALTGCRHAEIKTLKWEHVDFAKSCLRLPDSKTGAKVVHLADAAIDVLKKIPRVDGNPHVIPGAAPGAHFVNLQKAWVRFKNAAGLPDVRLHDLRHSFASVAVAEGMGLPVIGKILGHAQQTTTQNYAHLAADPVRLATEAIAVKISAAMSKS